MLDINSTIDMKEILDAAMTIMSKRPDFRIY